MSARIDWFLVCMLALYIFVIGWVVFCLAAWGLSLTGCTVQPRVTVEEVNVTMCISLVETNQGVKEVLVYCDAGEGINLTEAGVVP